MKFEDFIEDYDAGNAFNPTTGEFTAPSDGLYHFDINITTLEFNGITPELTVKVKKNGQTFNGSAYYDETSADNKTISFSLNTYLVTGDAITVWIDGYSFSVHQVAGNSFKIAGGESQFSSTFSGFKIN